MTKIISNACLTKRPPWTTWRTELGDAAAMWQHGQAEGQHSPAGSGVSGLSLNGVLGGEDPGGADQDLLVPLALQACWLVPCQQCRPRN